MMKIDWQAEIDSRKDALMKDLYTLLRINSVRDLAAATAEFPVGAGPAEALLTFLKIGERDGFSTKNIDNLAGHIEYGQGDETFGVFTHVDVVPVGDGWKTDPFEPTVIDGKLFARGSNDDKGPLIASYYGLKLIKELGLPVSKKVRFIVGTDEENGWQCMHRYLEVEPAPDFGFSPDAHFPIVNGEKGIGSFIIRFNDQLPDTSQDTNQLISFEGGMAYNMVPSKAEAVVKCVSDEQLSDVFANFLAKNPVEGTLTKEGENTIFMMSGKASHGQRPQDGINAATYLATFLANVTLDDAGQHYVKSIASYLHLDHYGKLMGIDYEDDIMGVLTSSANLFKYDPEGEKSIYCNIRWPKGIDENKIMSGIKTSIEGVTVESDGPVKTPHYCSPEDPIVRTLLDVYEEHTGQKGYETIFGAATYGRIISRGVAYGALFPGRENVMHQANEYMFIEDIFKSAAIYADAIYRCIK